MNLAPAAPCPIFVTSPVRLERVGRIRAAAYMNVTPWNVAVELSRADQ